MSGTTSGEKPMHGWHAPPQYDVSPEEADRIRRRQEIRRRLKAEFNRLNYNPYKIAAHVEILDPAVQRFSAMRASMYDYWKPTWKGFFLQFCVIWVPIIALGKIYDYRRREFDRKCRSGEIPYEARRYKF